MCALCNLVINIIVNWLPSIFSLVVILGSQCPKYCKKSLMCKYVCFIYGLKIVVVVAIHLRL